MDCVLMLIHIVFGLVCVLFFFFKQKTAYEMRISDWSSDVCSSDLTFPGGALNSGLYLSARRGCRCGHRHHRSKQQRRRQPSTRNRGCEDFCQETHFRPTPSGTSETRMTFPSGSTMPGTGRLPMRSEERRMGKGG